MDDDYPRNPPLGAPKRSGPKVPNPANDRRRAREREAALGIAPVQQPPPPPVSAIPAFGANSIVSDDWTLHEGVIGPVMEQIGDTCASVVLSYLLQAQYNRGKVKTLQHEVDIQDLIDYIQGKTSKLAISNINIALNYIMRTGILKLRDNHRVRLRIKGRYEVKTVSRNEVFAMIEGSPLGLSLEDTVELQALRREVIYQVPLHRQPRTGAPELPDHMVMVVAKGRDAQTGAEFLVIQNSWGDIWCNQGFARISLHPEGRFSIIKPVEASTSLQ